jgi:shikimate kinase
MGSGKTTVGVPLAELLGRPFVDNDAALEKRTGETARELQSEEGADGLHRAEAEVLRDALASRDLSVVAAAAGAVLEAGMGAELAGHLVVYLRAAPDVLAQRVVAAADDYRPFGDRTPANALREQFDERDAIYCELADVIVDATEPEEEIVDTITAALAR